MNLPTKKPTEPPLKHKVGHGTIRTDRAAGYGVFGVLYSTTFCIGFQIVS